MRKSPRYVVCVYGGGDEDLEWRKVYEVLPDERASEIGYVRVIDESGEDYLYPERFFVALELPDKVTRALRSKPTRRVRNRRAVAAARPG